MGIKNNLPGPMIRPLIVLIASTTITVLLVLGVARLPGGEALGATLARTGDAWATDSFEDSLGTELNQLTHQHLRPMFLHLTMMHVARHALAVREEIVGSYPTASWQQVEPVYVSQASQDFESMRRRYDLAPAQAEQNAPQDKARLSTWSALAGIGFIIVWISLRRV